MHASRDNVSRGIYIYIYLYRYRYILSLFFCSSYFTLHTAVRSSFRGQGLTF